MSPFTCPGGPPTLLSAEHTGRQSRAKIASVGSTLKGCLCSHTQCAMMSSWHFKLSVARMPSTTADSHSPVGAKQVNGPRKNRPRESEAEPFLIIISFPILIKPPPPLTRMFTKPPNWPPCFRPGPLGPPVYLQQGSQRNPAKPKAGPAAAIILQRPPLHSEENTGSPCLSWDREAHHSHFSGLVPHKPLPPSAVVTPAPRASPRTHQHHPRTRAFAQAHPSACTTLSRPPRGPVPSPAANLAQMSPALLELTWSPYHP